MEEQVQSIPALHPSPSSSSASRTTGPITAAGACCPTCTTRTANITFKLVSFKPKFSGKPDENAEAHLLCTNDWMTAHHFVEAVKVQRFCLILLREARLWYHSLEPINVD